MYGEGSEFFFYLEQKVVSWEPIGDFREALARSRKSREQYRESFQAPEAKLLVVDDTPMNLTVIKGLLKKTKVGIDTAESGFECLDKLTREHYDLIFLDHRMPKMDGVETRQNMEMLEGNINQGVPVIALTANAASGAREEYISLGFTDYLSKPIDAKQLEKMVQRYLPDDKVLYIDELEAQVDITNVPETEQPEYTFDTLPDVDGLDWNFARVHLSEPELLVRAVQDFYSVIDLHADKLDGFYQNLPENEEAWNEYRILVHGMKSSAATVGITPSSGLAKLLEDASGNKNYALVSALHSPFLEEWRANKERLRGVFGLGEETEKQKEQFETETVRGLVEMVRASMEEFDTDQADVEAVLLS